MHRIVTVILLVVFATAVQAENWPVWRGPRMDGTSIDLNVPVQWSATTNVKWKTPIPGVGHASPIVWGDRIFLVSSLNDDAERVLNCVNRDDGKVLWRKTVLEAPLERIHKLNSYASSTPATDGQRVYVSFLDQDQMFIAAYDFDGNQLWVVRPGVFSSIHGYCASPVLWKDTVIVNGDHDGPAYIVALDKATGQTRWKIDRPNHVRSYCTPIIRRFDGRDQLILSGSKSVASYNPDSGEQHWVIDGPTEQFVASLVDNGKLLFMTAGFPDRHILAIRPDGRGNVTQSHIVWRTERGCSYVPSPIVVGDYFLVVADNGVASCFIADTGERHWMERLGGGHSASLVAANGLVYFTSDDGVTTVVRPGPKLDIVARNELGDEVYASHAISDGRLFIRSLNYLWCIEARP